MAFSLSKFVKDLTDPGWRERRDANKLAQQQMSEQERDKQKMISEAGITNDLNRSWANKYINSLSSLPQLTYNQGLSQLQRGLLNANNQVNQSMANRGITSGVDIGALVNNQANLGRGISQLQGQRLANIANTQGQSYNTMSGLNQGVLANIMSAYGYGNDAARTNYINQLSGIAQQKARSGSPLGNLLGTVISGYINPVGTAAGAVAGMGEDYLAQKPDTSYLDDMKFRYGGF
ncbi:MAG: hypothetical protein WDA26_00330 [Pusillimonas sp.]